MSYKGGELAIEMRNVCKYYSRFSLENFSLSLSKGEIMGLVGSSGAGKSTSLRLLLGFIQADAGSIKVLGNSIPENEIQAKQDVAYVSEDMRLYGDLSIVWHMQFIKKICHSWDEVYAQDILKRFDLNPQAKVKELSLGQRIKTTLLLALARRPKLLVLDEPSTGLDPVARFELSSELMSIMLNEENSVIFSSQHTQDVERLSDKIAFMDKGQLISCVDKEVYLDKWKRVDVKCLQAPPKTEGVISQVENVGGYSVFHSDYSPRLGSQYEASGCEVVNIQNLNLEEIFIQQVLQRRRVNQEVGGQ